MSAKCSLRLGDRLVNALAALWYRLDRRHREIARRNLAFAYGPELSPRSRTAWPGKCSATSCASVGKQWSSSWRPFLTSGKEWVILGEENVVQALAQGRGMFAIAAHAGNWGYTVMGYALMYRRWPWWPGKWTTPCCGAWSATCASMEVLEPAHDRRRLGSVDVHLGPVCRSRGSRLP